MAKRRGKGKKKKPSKPARRSAAPPPRRPHTPRKPKAVPLPRRKPAKLPKPGEVVVKPAQHHLRTEERVLYRIRGKFVKKGTRGAKRFPYVVQLDRKGTIIRYLEKTSPKTIYKTVVPTRIGYFETPDHQYQGRIDWALIESSITSELRRTKMVDITMRWKDGRGKHSREKLVLDVDRVRRKNELPQALAGLLIEKLRDRGFRTQYTLRLYKLARAKGLKEPMTWEYWRTLEVARDLEIIVTLHL